MARQEAGQSKLGGLTRRRGVGIPVEQPGGERADFRSADGRPYRNVYVFRFDWQDGKIVAWEEYANPITILRTFPDVYGDLLRQLAAVAVEGAVRVD